MNKLVFTLVALLALSASAQYKRGAEWLDRIPDPYQALNGLTHFGASETIIHADGWTNATPQELAARAAAQAEEDAIAASNSAYQASLPVPMPTGIEAPWIVLLDATNRTKGIAMELTASGQPIYYEFHASPVDWARVDSNRTAAFANLFARSNQVAQARSSAASAKAKAPNDNSVPQLRETVSNLAAAVERLSEALEVR